MCYLRIPIRWRFERWASTFANLSKCRLYPGPEIGRFRKEKKNQKKKKKKKTIITEYFLKTMQFISNSTYSYISLYDDIKILNIKRTTN